MATRKTRLLFISSSLLLFGILAFCAGAVPKPFQDSQQAPQADNTKKNLPTEHKDANRADQQSNARRDIELTRKIRQSISQDKSLSTYAHNIKIITRNGVVQLKGPVRSQQEKDAVGAKATEIAGAENVKNELVLKAS
ncbi:MAG: BON domain-containing protein [Acidobacteriota bacterium]|nr:BON domain-containing protein [Acidobacteriota bacterium]